MFESLLTTKLYIPPPGRYLVERQRLLAKLNDCLLPGCRLSLISAPAGFGKTTLVTSWIKALKAAEPGASVSWLSIDEGDNDPVTFWSYLIAALRTVQEGIGGQALDLLSSSSSGMESIPVALINDLIRVSHPWVLVLDDYHLIRNPVIHQLLSSFIDRIPPQFHLAIASRTDPPLPLALLRGRGQLLELRLNDLRFSNEDARLYLNEGAGLNLASQSIETLNQKTEGWAAGLQMAALSLKSTTQDAGLFPSREKLDGFIASFSGSNRYILDYLVEEVLNRQPEAVQNFLIRTSILDRLCGPLCDAILAGDIPDASQPSQMVLETLENANLFIIPLDDQRYWYRYHHLFADLLRKRLGDLPQAVVTDLHRRAIAWYEQNGLIPSAIDHAFQIRDFAKAAALISPITEVMWGRGERTTLLSWLNTLPDEEKQKYPHMLVFQVSMLISAGKMQEAEACIPVIEKIIQDSLSANPEKSPLTGRMYALRTYIASFYGDRPSVFRYARMALENLTREEDAGQRCGVTAVLSNAYLVEGELENTIQALEDSVADAKKARRPHMIMTGVANLALALIFKGNLKHASLVCQEGLQLIQQIGLDHSPMAADLHISWGEILCERGDLEAAETFIRRGLDVAREQHYVWQMAMGYQAEARLLMAQGNLPAAEAVNEEVGRLASSEEIPAYILCRAAGLQVKILLRQGKIGQAAQYLQERGIQSNGEVGFPHHWEYLALSRLNLARGDTTSAAQLLHQINAWAETTRNTGAMISALLLQALVEHTQGNLGESMQSLALACDMAEPEGYAQVFVDEGEPVIALLREAVRQNIHALFAERLLQSLPGSLDETEISSVKASLPEQPRTAVSGSYPLVEPLSKREMEILQLIAEGLSNKDIAQKLYLSLRTVKYYSTNLYNKLGVDGRMQAVIRARELGLIS